LAQITAALMPNSRRFLQQRRKGAIDI